MRWRFGDCNISHRCFYFLFYLFTNYTIDLCLGELVTAALAIGFDNKSLEAIVILIITGVSVLKPCAQCECNMRTCHVDVCHADVRHADLL